MEVFVIAPDKASGTAFNQVLVSKKIETELEFFAIEPRVVENKINTSEKVTRDLEDAIRKAKSKQKNIVIACNTLQFWIPKVDEELLRGVKIFTTFDASLEKYKNSVKKPVWLGTTPTATLIKEFPTLVSLKLNYIQDLLQEIIWRVKMRAGDDYSNAPEVVKKDADNLDLQNRKLTELRDLVLEFLRQEGIKEVILGCTELPVVFAEFKQNKVKMIDAAEILAEQIINTSSTSK